MAAENGKLHIVLEKIKAAWYPQLDRNGEEIELTDVNQRNVSLETPLLIAAHLLGPEDIQVLVENGADINAQSGSEQHLSALHIARLMGRFDNAEKLMALGADANLVDGIGKTPLDYGKRADQQQS